MHCVYFSFYYIDIYCVSSSQELSISSILSFQYYHQFIHFAQIIPNLNGSWTNLKIHPQISPRYFNCTKQNRVMREKLYFKTFPIISTLYYNALFFLSMRCMYVRVSKYFIHCFLCPQDLYNLVGKWVSMW